MSPTKVSVTVTSNRKEANKALKRALAIWADATGGEMVNLTHRPRTQGGTPVDTGRLRNSMTFAKEPDNKTVYVGTNVEYGEPVEEGARGRGGAHMLRNAVMDVKPKSKEFLKEALEAQKIK